MMDAAQNILITVLAGWVTYLVYRVRRWPNS